MVMKCDVASSRGRTVLYDIICSHVPCNALYHPKIEGNTSTCARAQIAVDWLASEFESRQFVFTPHRNPHPTCLAGRPPLTQCLYRRMQWIALKIQHRALFGCVEGIEWESHLVLGLLVRS
jgi:hypothetical protein